MTQNTTKLFKNASPLAEKKIRTAHAQQAQVTKDIVKAVFRALAAQFRLHPSNSRPPHKHVRQDLL